MSKNSFNPRDFVSFFVGKKEENGHIVEIIEPMAVPSNKSSVTSLLYGTEDFAWHFTPHDVRTYYTAIIVTSRGVRGARRKLYRRPLDKIMMIKSANAKAE